MHGCVARGFKPPVRPRGATVWHRASWAAANYLPRGCVDARAELTMCGIAGFTGAPDRQLLHEMADRIRHRGPDSDGFFSTDEIHLGMRRLAVIDVAGGKQPIFNETGDVVVVFNGEIYNYRELRTSLIEKGHRFATQTDTEILVHLYEEYGIDFVERLNGMFAFALWDAGRKRLYLARDPLGIKPLYYTQLRDRLAFSSELKSLLILPGLSREISPQALERYLSYGSIAAPHSIFRAVNKLPPGHWLLAEQNSVRLQCYWSLPPPDESMQLSHHYGEVEELLGQAVKSQLISDVPLGVFLSGGLDSSAVVAFASRHSSTPLKTFSIGYASPDEDYNETAKARQIAEHFGCDHREFILSPNIGELLAPLVRCFDEPFADSSAVPTYLISRETRQHVTVALTGVGGDELFGGYPRYMGLLFAQRLSRMPMAVRRFAGSIVSNWPDRGGSVNWTGRIKRFFGNAEQPLAEQYSRWLAFLSPELVEDLLQAGGVEDTEPDRCIAPLSKLPSLLAQNDMLSYLPSDLLCHTDRVSMAHSLEARVPFLDKPLVEFMARVPLTDKLAGFRLKSPLKKILQPLLPKEILSQKKMGFSIPLARWLREELVDVLDDCLNPSQLKDRGLLRPEAVQRLRMQHSAGKANHADALWSLLMLEIWFREYMDGP